MSTEVASGNVSSLSRWGRRVVAVGAVVAGVGFILWHNHFHTTPSVVMLCMGWTAVVATVYLLWRVGVAGGEPTDSAENWWLDATPRDELEREKRSLLRTIRDIEFDHQTGKLSDRDAEEMNRVTRARAIEVMKALDAVESDGDVRAQIELEVRARLQIEGARKAGKGKAPKKGGKAASKEAAKAAGGDGARAATTVGAVATAAQEPAPVAEESAPATKLEEASATKLEKSAAASESASGEGAGDDTDEKSAAASESASGEGAGDDTIEKSAAAPTEAPSAAANAAPEPAVVTDEHGKARSSSLGGSV